MKHHIVLFFSFSILTILFPARGVSQLAQNGNTVLQRAHKLKIDKCEFLKTDKELFLTKVFSVDEAKANKSHHWFLQLLDLDGEAVNYAEVEVSGYFKDDPSIKFKYLNPVFKLCSEGKYIIGFVKVKNNGTWVLDVTIDDFGKEDSFTYEIEIGEKLQ